MLKKLKKYTFFLLKNLSWFFSSRYCTTLQYRYFKSNGMVFLGMPRYISAKVWFDGTDYSIIEIGEGVTISSNIRILTHDWALDTVYHGIYGKRLQKPLGKIRPVKIGNYCFIGTGSIVMPGAEIGDYCIVGAGTVVRGKIPSYSIVVGNPAQVVGNSKEYLMKNLKIKEDAS